MDRLTIKFLEKGILDIQEDFPIYNCYFIPKKSCNFAGNEYVKDQYCLYFLLNTDEGREAGKKRKIYIGQTTDFKGRMADHSRKKNWWNSVVVFCNPYPTFDINKIKTLEKFFIEAYSAEPDVFDKDNSQASDVKIDESVSKLEPTILFVMKFLRYGLGEKELASEVTSGKKKVKTGEDEKKRPPFRFSMIGLAPGDCITLKGDPSKKFKIVSDTKVEYNGGTASLSPLAKELLGLSSAPQGPAFFEYNGELLSDLRDKKESE